MWWSFLTQGTGLFIGTGSALANGGPISLVLGFALMGLMVWTLMCSLGRESKDDHLLE
jgi:amino acid permease